MVKRCIAMLSSQDEYEYVSKGLCNGGMLEVCERSGVFIMIYCRYDTDIDGFDENTSG